MAPIVLPIARTGKLNALIGEMEGFDSYGPSRVKSLVAGNATTFEKTKATKELMYVRAVVNRKEGSTMADTKATYNFVVDHIVG